MQALILAAGRGTRMGTLTNEMPKPMLMVGNKNLIEHKLDALPKEVDEVILLIGYQGDAIRNYFGSEARGRKITYVTQEKLDGTAGAVWAAREVLRDRFLILMGDDLYAREDMQRCIATPDWSMVVSPIESMHAGGNISLGENGAILGVEEGDHSGKPGLMGTNLVMLDTRFFDLPPTPKSPDSSEYGLPQTAVAISKAKSIPFTALSTTFWHQITSPEDLVTAAARLHMLK